MSESFLTKYRHWLLERRTQRARDLDPNKTYDLRTLYKRGFVRPKATGQTIQTIQGELENRINKPLRVVIPVGTYFVAQGNYQNMVTNQLYKLELSPAGSVSFAVSATCINADLPIPGEDDRFYGVEYVSEPLERFLTEAVDCSPMVIQAGVWAITDGYTAYQIREHLVSRDGEGNSRPAVSEDDLTLARNILERLNIPTRL